MRIIRLETRGSKGEVNTEIVAELADDGALVVSSSGPSLPMDVVKLAREMVAMRRELPPGSLSVEMSAEERAESIWSGDKDAQANADRWNAQFSVGTEVIIEGIASPSVTLTKARVEYGRAVVDVVGIELPCVLSRLKPTHVPPFVQQLIEAPPPSLETWDCVCGGVKRASGMLEVKGPTAVHSPTSCRAFVAGAKLPSPASRKLRAAPLVTESDETEATDQALPAGQPIGEPEDVPVRHAATLPLSDEMKAIVFAEAWKAEGVVRKKRDRAERAFMESVHTAGDVALFAEVMAGAIGTPGRADLTYTFFSTWRDLAPDRPMRDQDTPVVTATGISDALLPAEGRHVHRIETAANDEAKPETDDEPFGGPEPEPLARPNPYRVEFVPSYITQRVKPFRVVERVGVGTAKVKSENRDHFDSVEDALGKYPGAACAPETHATSTKLARERAGKKNAREVGLVGASTPGRAWRYGLLVDGIPDGQSHEFLDDAIGANPGIFVRSDARDIAIRDGNVSRPKAPAPSAVPDGPDSDDDVCTCGHARADHGDDGGACMYSAGKHCAGFTLKARAVAEPADDTPSTVIDINHLAGANGQPFGFFDRDEWPTDLAWPPSANVALPRGTPPPIRAYVSIAQALQSKHGVHVTAAALQRAAEIAAAGPQQRIGWSEADGVFVL